MNQSVNRLNELSADDAQTKFLKCCGSVRWSQLMTGARPFASIDNFFSKASEIWWGLNKADWLEAFRAHPQIGEKNTSADRPDTTQSWSAQEQSAVEGAAIDIKKALADANLEYKQRFGFIFIVCATGKSAEEMLTILNRRLHNDPETEIRVAAEEQRKITQLRLEKLLNE